MVNLLNKKITGIITIFLLLMIILSSFFIPKSFAISETNSLGISYDENNHPYQKGQLIIGYRGNTTAIERRSIHAEMALELKANLKSINGEVVVLTNNENAKEALSKLKNNPNVLFAEYDYLVNIDYIPNDERYPYQVYLEYMNAADAWDYSKGTSDVTVAALDTGILTSNTDLNNIDVSGYNVADSNSDYSDPTGHGTAVISVIAAEMDNIFGFAGVAPNSSFMVVRVIDEQGYSTYSDLIQGLEYATANGADVINMSLSGRSDSLSLKMAIDNTYNSGITIVAAAGNESSTTVSYPANYSNVIGVGAVNTFGEKMTFSNTGDGLTVVAGGSAMIATSTDYITTASGTSFAAPYVTGLVSLLYSVDDNMTPNKVINILETTSTDLGDSGYDTTFGYGVVNMGKAVEMAVNNSTQSPPPVEDTVSPVLTINGDSQMNIEVGSTYNEPGAQATDNVDGDISDNIVISGTVDTSTVGQYTLEYSVTDEAGNLSNIEMRSVEVNEASTSIDETPPVLTLNGDSQMSIEVGSTYNEPGAQAIDNVDGDISDNIVISGTVDTSTVGQYTLEYSVTDAAGNQSNVETRNVDVYEIVEIPEETQLVRDVEIIEGSLNKRTSSITHVISVNNSGELDVDLTFKGKAAPNVSIDNLGTVDNSGTFEVAEGDYNMTIQSEDNVKFTVTLTYPEYEVPADVPLGTTRIITYEPEPEYIIFIYLGILLIAAIITIYVYRKRKIKEIT